MISENIKQHINEDFVNIKSAIKTHLEPGFDISQTKQFLQTQIPKEVVYKTEILLDTLLNYLMKDAQRKIKTADVTLQNTFYDADFRKRIHEWTSQKENKLVLEPEVFKFSADTRFREGLVSGGTTFVIGSLATALITSKAKTINMATGKEIVSWNPYFVAGAIVAGIATILLSVYTFKLGYNKASNKVRELIKKDVDQYLETSQKQVESWLENVQKTFKKEFQDFCRTNDLILEEKSNE